ncbi:DUF4132 domain-containing protein [Chitinophaga oryziterrae]|uniref:DUF4132 domain-containing protein n=1 Tax=Chitinophaga oryziterrae TaxID=1031224 RepID=A0A6N8JBG4_9BACT|nr:DUF4132 domain-containing protein [Chitinophaga oryziterrae]MVT41861.1 DUF4132 domain-containing protein [Chitinophaga oryziterrae]
MQKEVLNAKVIPNPLENYAEALKSNKLALSANARELGLLLLNDAEEKSRRRDIRRWPVWPVDRHSERYKRIAQLLGDQHWDNEENYNLLLFFFGAEKAAYMRYAWKQAPYQMYQEGYARRSFRSPNTPHNYLARQINNLIHILPQAYRQSHDENFEYITIFYDLTIVEQIRYNYLMAERNPEIFRLWSAAVDMGNTDAFQVLEDIIYNKDAEGKVTQNIIKALLNSDKPEAWKLIEQLLLSAQRQEGLRQVILESLDETSIGAMKHLLRVIVDNDLVRFSSVVRAIDVWVGMGWESEREPAVKKFMEKAIEYLEYPGLIPAALKSDNNADVFMGLWAQGVYDVQQTVPYLKQLYEKGNVQKRALALLFADNTRLNEISFPLHLSALNDKELMPLALAVNALHSTIGIRDNANYYNQHYPDLFHKLHEVYKRVTVKEITFPGAVFSWLKIEFSSSRILMAMIMLVGEYPDRMDILTGYMDEMDSLMKRMLTIRVLPEYAAYDVTFKTGDKCSLTDFQYKYAMLILKDRFEFDTAYKVLYHTQFTTEELSTFPALLKRKAAEFRGNIISLLLRQTDKALIPVIQEILKGDAEQRMAALDMLIQLKKKNRLANESAVWITAFRERKSISSKEEVLLSQLGEGSKTNDTSAENGYGLFDPKQCVPVIDPVIDRNNLYEKMLAKYPYAFSVPMETLREAITELCDLFEAHKEEEYEEEGYDGVRSKVLLGNALQYHLSRRDTLVKDEIPLHEVWQAWYEKWALTPSDLFLMIQAFTQPFNAYAKIFSKQLPAVEEFISGHYSRLNRYSNPIMALLSILSIYSPFENADEFALGATTRMFASLGDELLEKGTKADGPQDYREGWQQLPGMFLFLKLVKPETMPDELVASCWNLYHWRQFSGLKESIPHNITPLMVYCRAYEKGIIGEPDLLRGIMEPEHMRLLSSPRRNEREFDYMGRFPFLQPLFEKARNHVLDIELKRGDLPTSVTFIAEEIQSLFGVNRFAEIIAGLGKTTLRKGYYWGGGDAGKTSSFSDLLKQCLALPTDTQEQFNAAMQQIKANEQRLIDAAMYAPQWQWFVSNYLGWKGLDSAIWWMHAHTKTDGYKSVNSITESAIARYSSLDVEEFKNGAVDKEWFLKAYKEIGAEHWPMVYDAAKYITDGNGHRRARIYADVLLGVLNLKEVTEKIMTKRDQDYVRIYGLAPLNKTNKAKDILARYEFLQQFKKESKQFGAQKQSSEALSIQISMENLARNAGYPDPIRLTWAMETKQVQAILSKETQVQYDDVLIGLIIDEKGEADVVSFKGDKVLKDIPSKYKKDKKIEELNGFKKTLREQFRRSRIGLEEAMVRGDLFLMSEVKELFTHPVIAKHLEKLVFISEEKHGFYHDGTLVNADGEVSALNDKDQLRIAHCTDLYSTGSWSAYQHYAFDKKLQQPFKQIFRELYLITDDERQEVAVSRRYAGHQVQPKQTLALLRSRGWKTNYEQGLQKVYHKEGFAACMYAMADWFSPAEMENPTLETLAFMDLKTFKNVPFDKVHPRIFSEVMRDIDLVVSVAHAGGVDPEASHSSIEMRSVLLKETLRLFKLDNVTMKGSHALIKGSLGEYSVHLGSAVVHRVLSGYLSILPVHSQHRGRLFLPFMDDDPRTAELLSKVLLLARDNEIQDPTILRQIADNN